MRILAIETSCDETAIALVKASGGLNSSAGSELRFKILKNLVASQVKIHRPYGGIVPNLAKREHLKNLPILFKKIFPTEKFFNNIDLIAVTVGPGLEPALWTGINFTKEIYKQLQTKKPRLHQAKPKLIGVSHLEGHLYSNLLNSKQYVLNSKNLFPAIGLIISGGHTMLLLMKDLTHYKKLGETRDDAVGECFDKVARLLNLPYPGGPEIEKLAKYGSPTSIYFPRPMINQKNYDFSFSGLKTSVLYYLKNSESLSLHEASLSDIAASFQIAAFDALISKTLRAVQEFKAKSILISGGVASNSSLRNYLKLRIKNRPFGGSSKIELGINLFIPPKKFCTDNAAMIAVAGYFNYLKKKKYRLVAQGNLSLS